MVRISWRQIGQDSDSTVPRRNSKAQSRHKQQWPQGMQAWVGSLDQQTAHMGASGSVVSLSPVWSTNSGGKSRVKSTSSGTVKSTTDPKSKPSMSVLDEGAMWENVAIFLQLTQRCTNQVLLCVLLVLADAHSVHGTLLDVMSVHSVCSLCTCVLSWLAPAGSLSTTCILMR